MNVTGSLRGATNQVTSMLAFIPSIKAFTELGFAWNFNGVLKFFTFKLLPFGLSSAYFCFTKLLRPLVTGRRWRTMGHIRLHVPG